MATQLFFRGVTSDYSTGNNDAKLDGSASGWVNVSLATTRGAGAQILTANTVAGATNGVELAPVSNPYAFISPPLDADVTIAGSITWNLRASESSMSANVAINGVLEVIDGATGAFTLIDQTARTTELGTSEAAANFAETPAAGVACKRGDRLRVRVFGDDAGTMASGFTFTFWLDGPTAAASGDSYLTLTENLTFASEPAGTTLYPTGTASAVATADNDLEAWTSRGGGVATAVASGSAGWEAPIQMDTGGAISWFTKPLQAVTLGGAVRCNVRARETSASTDGSFRVEVAICDGDGTNPVVWAAASWPPELTTTEAALSLLIAGDDVALTDGQRLRIRFFADDPAAIPATGTGNVTLYYAGTSGGASGDTYLTFSQTLTEYVPPITPKRSQYPQLLAH